MQVVVVVSSASVYVDDTALGAAGDRGEPDAATARTGGDRRPQGEHYGPQKVGCERALRDIRRDTALILAGS
ncbi:MAG: hypothetical protein ABJA16_05305 [Nakamurella sp.]